MEGPSAPVTLAKPAGGLAPTRSSHPAKRSNTQATALAIATYFGLAIIMYWHAWTSPTTNMQLGPDAFLNTWFLAWVPFSLGHAHLPFFTDYINYPYGVNVLQQTSELALGFLVTPITLLWGPIASYNVLMTSSLALSSTSAFFLIRRVTRWKYAAFIGGLTFGFSPYMIGQTASEHLHLCFIAIPPLIFLVLYELCTGHRGSPAKLGILLAALIVVQFFISTEVLATTGIVAVLALITTAVVCRHSVRARLPSLLKGLAWAGGLSLVLLAYPAWFAIDGTGHVSGALQLVPQGYRADLLGTFVPNSVMLLSPHSLTRTSDHFTNSIYENGSYLGVPLVLVSLVAVVRLRRRAIVVITAITGAAALLLSLGGALVVSKPPQVSSNGNAVGRVPLPEALFQHLPALSNLIPARFAAYVALAAAILLAIFLDEVRTVLSARNRERALPVRGVSVLAPVLISMVCLIPIVPTAPLTTIGDLGVPLYFTSDAVNRIPAGSVALLYPYPTEVVSRPQVWQATAGINFRVPGGYFLVPYGKDHRLTYSDEIGFSAPTLPALVFTRVYQGDPPRNSPELKSALLHVLHSWKVQTVIASPQASPQPAKSVQFLVWLLGAPSTVSHGSLLWVDVNSR